MKNFLNEGKKDLLTGIAVLTTAGLLIGSNYVSNNQDMAVGQKQEVIEIKSQSGEEVKETEEKTEEISNEKPKETESLMAKEDVEEDNEKKEEVKDEVKFEHDAPKEVEKEYEEWKNKERTETHVATRGAISKGNKSFERYAMHDIPMPIEHQKYLYNLCEQRNIDYVKALAILKHESQFKANNVSSTNDYGYMQINKGNHKWLAGELGTANAPLDPYVNMNWGTHMLGTLYSQYRAKGLSGEALDRATWSAYNKGVAGYNKYGEATRYIQRTKNEIQWINNKLGL